MPFYINRPDFRGYGDEVFEGELTTNSLGLPSIRVITPSFAARWPSVSPNFMCETDGPARKVAYKEYDNLRLTPLQPFVSPISAVVAVQAALLEEEGSDSSIGQALRLRLVEYDALGEDE